MSKHVCTQAIDGAVGFIAQAESALDAAIAKLGENHAVAFPDTAYSLPVIYSMTGEKMETLVISFYVA